VVLDRNAEAMQRLEKAERIFTENAFLHLCKRDRAGQLGMRRIPNESSRFRLKLGSVDDAPAALADV